MGNDTVTLKLKDALLNYKNESFKDISALNLSQQQLMATPEKDLLKIAPIDTIGNQLATFLVGIIQPKTPEDAAKLSRWAAKIHNKMISDKGELDVDEKDLKELIVVFKTNTIPVKNSNALGSIIIYLEDKEVELNQKKKNPPTGN